jgi:uncharacterized protein (TIRG00374 family)
LIEKIRKKILISLILAGVIYLVFTIYADYRNVILAFSRFSWILLPVVLMLSMMNYLTRFLKWDYYLNLLEVKIKKADSFAIFMSGLIMSITPGKFGELLKSYLVKEVSGVPISKTAPIIFVERITDFLSLLIIAVAGAYVFNYGGLVVVAVSAFFAFIVIVILNRKLALSILSFVERSSFLKKHISKLHNAYESSYTMLKPAPLFLMTILSLISWGFECLGYYLIIINFHIELNILWASFIYAFSTIVGAISMMPGGLGITEGSLTYLVINKGYSKDVAFASTFIIRVVTLWFAVFVGILSVALYQKRYGKIIVELDEGD